MTGYESVAEALAERGLVKDEREGRVQALCPSHPDSRASLSVAEGDDGRALVYCHAGCDTLSVMESLDLGMSDLFTTSQGSVVVATYMYVDEDGSPLIRVTRTHPKGFFQERWTGTEWKPGLEDTRRVLYRLPEVRAAVSAGEPVYFVEGEKDADNIVAVGHCATTMLGGAGKWRSEYSEPLAGARVVLVPDGDEAGRLGSERIRAGLGGVVSDLRVLMPRVGKDVTDHLLAGYGLDELLLPEDGLGEFSPIDWDTYEVPDADWLYEPFIPRGGRVLAFGPAGSLKSLWAMWVGTKLAREGRRIAYFSLEMLPSDAVRRIRQLAPPKDRFSLYTRLELGSPSDTERMIAGLKGHDLIVIDSWTAAVRRYVSNEEVARLDSGTLLPVIKATGAAILILDNTGHDFTTTEGKQVKVDHARGASAKGDKMEVTLWFRNPSLTNNYRTRITHKKMRLDYPMPTPVEIETPKDRIEFYHVEGGVMTTRSLWVSSEVTPSQDFPTVVATSKETMTARQEREEARNRDKFKEVDP